MKSNKKKSQQKKPRSIDEWLRNGTFRHDITRVKPYSAQELSYMYEACRKTFKKWIAPFAPELGARIGRYYSVYQVELIFMNLGVPYSIREGE